MKKILILCLLASLHLSGTAQEDTGYKPVALPTGFTASLNVVYTKVSDWEGKMDLYLPPVKEKPTPVVINIHGGGWNKGNKESQTGFSTFFKMGYAVANIAYRLTGQATAPAAIEDARCALIYLIRNAKQLNIDVNKIVIMGGSAGGHLALMAGLLENDRRFDTNCPGAAQVKVAAIIDKFGITDVWAWGYGPGLRSNSAIKWLGEKVKDKSFADSLSPVYYVSKTSPPTFIVHGDADPVVSYSQSVALHNKLQEAGVTTKFMTVPGGLHGKFPNDKNKEVNQAIAEFLKSLGIF